MSDTTSTPEEPDARGTVATGGSGPAATPAPGGDGAAAGNGSANGAAKGAAPEKVSTQKTAPADRGVAADGETKPVVTGAAPDDVEPTAPDVPTSAVPPPAAAGPSPGPAQPAADEPTVVSRTPIAPNGHQPASSSGAERPPVPGPRPAPGPVPGPGPEAASPPPWNRVPGQEARDRQDPPPPPPQRSTGSVGDLLGDGPTVVMGPDAAQSGGRPSSGSSATGGWQAVRATRNRTPRQAALQLKRLDPWSVLKLALVLAVVLFFIWLVAVGVLYAVLGGMGVWDQLNGTIASLSSDTGTAGSPLISAGRVFGFAAVVGAINSLLFAVAMTISAFVYNVSADLVGGVEVTLSERD